MTPREMLAPQPPPTKGGSSVTDWLVSALERSGADPIVAELVRLRREQGTERYGTELTTHNGRNVRCDQLQEAVDLLFYGGQESIENGETGFDVEFDDDLVNEIAELARALERE